MSKAISSHYTQVESVNIHYTMSGQGETILFLHGWPTSSYLWRNILPGLATKYQVIALDLPGFGNSDKRLEDSFSFRYFNRIISGFLKNLEIETVTLGIHDLGGPIGLNWTIHNMEKVNRLILFNTLVYPKLSWAVKLFGLATVVPGVKNWLSSPIGIKKAINFGVHQKHRLTNEIIQQYQAPFKDKNARKVLLKSVQRLSIKGFQEIERKLPSFKKPVQILYGERDNILPKVKKTMERVKRDLPQAQIRSFPDCGHFLQEESPKQLSDAILNFMR